jgi:hypothetical protein
MVEGGEQMADEHLFTCKKCGSHRLKVIQHYRTATIAQESMPCGCTPGAVAATRRVQRLSTWEEVFELNPEHHLSERRDEPRRVDVDERETEIDVACRDCYGKGTWSGEEDDLTEEPVEDEAGLEFWVRCWDCDREIPFAWTEKGLDGKGAGRIWPVECTDYDPDRTWLDPRYRKSGGDG